jgi:hypothetical protein
MTHTSRKLSDIGPGEELPPLEIPITTSLVVAGALASRDFTPVHHDKGAARAAGMQDVFMNILTTNGLVGRYVSDWAGPDARIRNVAIKLGTPNVPGDRMTLTGKVASVHDDEVTLEIAGTNSWGSHVTGSVRVALPR